MAEGDAQRPEAATAVAANCPVSPILPGAKVLLDAWHQLLQQVGLQRRIRWEGAIRQQPCPVGHHHDHRRVLAQLQPAIQDAGQAQVFPLGVILARTVKQVKHRVAPLKLEVTGRHVHPVGHVPPGDLAGELREDDDLSFRLRAGDGRRRRSRLRRCSDLRRWRQRGRGRKNWREAGRCSDDDQLRGGRWHQRLAGHQQDQAH